MERSYQSYDHDYYGALPFEILIKIFDYLNPADRFFAGQTCKRFLEVSEHYNFTNDSKLQFTSTTFSDNVAPAKDFAQSFRSFPNVSFLEVEFNDSRKFWAKHGENVESLTINCCDITVKKMRSILNETPNLMHLKIENSRELFMSGRFEDEQLKLDEVVSLSLPQNRYLSDSLFSRMTRLMPKLSSLDLSSNSISFHRGLYKKFYPANCDDEIGSESVFTFHFIRKLIMNRAEKIKHLNFNSTLIDGNTLEMLSEIENLKLNSLHLRHCDQLTNVGFISLINTQKQLTHLDLSFSVRITDPSLIAICENLKALKVLKLRRCRALTDISVKMVIDLPLLEVFDISECEALTSASIIDGIGSKQNLVLRELYMSALNICEKVIIKVTENIPNLLVLDLSCCFNHVDDICVQMIFKHLIWLRELNLDQCERISDAGFTGMEMKEKIENFEKSQQNEEVVDKPEPIVSGSIAIPDPTRPPSLKISLRTKAEEEIVGDAMRKKAMMKMAMNINMEESASSNVSIARLRGLQVLKIGGCNKISDVSMIYNYKLPELKEINLSKCQQISIDGIKALVESCPSLEIVNMAECHSINDKCIEIISMKLSRLTNLNLSRCFQLTDYSLDYIALNCKRIRELNIQGCRYISDEPQLRLVNASSLQKISFSKQGSISDSSTPIPPAPRMMQSNSRSFPMALPLPFRY